MVKGHIKEGKYEFATVLEEVIGDRLEDGRVYANAELGNVHIDVVNRAKKYSIKTSIADKIGNKMQIHFSFSDNTAIALDF